MVCSARRCWPLQTDSVAGREALTSSESKAVAVIISALPSRVANAAEKEKLPVAETGQF